MATALGLTGDAGAPVRALRDRRNSNPNIEECFDPDEFSEKSNKSKKGESKKKSKDQPTANKVCHLQPTRCATYS